VKAYRIPSPGPQDGKAARKRGLSWHRRQREQEERHQALADDQGVKPGLLTSALRKQKGGL
jgi:hypothetical protein